MWQDKLKEIIYILENSNINEIEVNFWGRKFRVVKKSSQTVNTDSNQNFQVTKPQKSQIDDPQKTNIVEKSDLEDMLSPMPGTYYSAPTPDDPPFVSKGDTVKKGQVLCIIEAMKIMNEIESDFDGIITDIKVDNGKPVEYNQTLFTIDPT